MPDDCIPCHWTPEQALAVVDFLEDLAEQIWSRYGLAIRECTLGPDPPWYSRQLPLPFPTLWEQRIDRDDDYRDEEDMPF